MTAILTNLKARVQFQIDSADSTTSLKDLLVIRKSAEGLGCVETNLDNLVTAKLATMNNSTELKDLLLGNVASDIPKAGVGVQPGSLVALGDQFPDKYVDTNGHTFLKSGLVESDPANFDTTAFTHPDISDFTSVRQLFTSGSTVVLKSVAYGNGIWIAVGSFASTKSFVARSTDGITWTDVTTLIAPWGELNSIAFAQGKFIAVGAALNAFFTTTDGLNWTSAFVSGLAVNPFRTIFFGNNLWVATGTGSNVAGIATSPDGVTWTPRNLPVAETVNGGAFGGGVYVLMANTRIFYSSNGTSWLTATTVPTNVMFAVTYAMGMFVAVGAAGLIYTSTDGNNWTPKTSGTGANIVSIVYDATSGFVASLGATGSMRRSMDANVWTDLSQINNFQSNTSNALAVGDGKIVHVGEGGAIAMSPVAVSTSSFIPVTAPLGTTATSQFHTFGGGVLIAFNSNGIYTTTDGITWTRRRTGTGELKAIAFNGTRICAIVGTNTTIYSDNFGVTWTNGSTLPMGIPTSAYIDSMAYGNGVFVVVGNAGTVAYSTTGTSWTTTTWGSDVLMWVVFYKGVFIVGVNNSQFAYISMNGITQTDNFVLPSNINSARVIGNRLFLQSGATVQYTDDFIKFTILVGQFPDITTVAEGNGILVAKHGTNNTFIVSKDNGATWSPRFNTGITPNFTCVFDGSLYASYTSGWVTRSQLKPFAGTFTAIQAPVRHMRIK